MVFNVHCNCTLKSKLTHYTVGLGILEFSLGPFAFHFFLELQNTLISMREGTIYLIIGGATCLSKGGGTCFSIGGATCFEYRESHMFEYRGS